MKKFFGDFLSGGYERFSFVVVVFWACFLEPCVVLAVFFFNS